MSKLQLLNVFVNERLSTAALKIFGAVEKTIAFYQEEIFRSAEENARLQRLLNLGIRPDAQLHRSADFQLLIPVVPPEHQNCDQGWGSSLGQEDQKPLYYKEQLQNDPESPSRLCRNPAEDNREKSALPSCKTEEVSTEPGGEGQGLPQTSDPSLHLPGGLCSSRQAIPVSTVWHRLQL
ncbi:hypothetical protein UPYG_G00022720 [Umbra pygmaea]|uniref:Uncharacterized protein n=1 Tax=Umbra pygmaea TaxID=75934 RepID=A0ABD0XL66_UMBPY